MNDLIGLFTGNPKTVFAVGVILPYVTRAIHSVRNGGGIRGIWRSIWFGTNVPSDKK